MSSRQCAVPIGLSYLVFAAGPADLENGRRVLRAGPGSAGPAAKAAHVSDTKIRAGPVGVLGIADAGSVAVAERDFDAVPRRRTVRAIASQYIC